MLIDRLLSRLSRSRLEPFVRLGKTIRNRDGILAAIRLGINQGRTEALNNKVSVPDAAAPGACWGPVASAPPILLTVSSGSHLTAMVG